MKIGSPNKKKWIFRTVAVVVGVIIALVGVLAFPYGVEIRYSDNILSLYTELNKAVANPGYPQVAGSNTSTDSGTTHTVNLPSGIQAGETLLVFFVCDDDEASIDFPNEGTDWIQIYEQNNTGQGPTLAIAWREATGSEGSTISVDTPSSEGSAHITMRITDAADPDTSPPEAEQTSSVGNSEYPDPPTLTLGASNEYLWIAVEGNDDNDTTSAWPTNYSDNNLYATESSCNIALGTREYTGSFQNPDLFTLSAGEQWISTVVAVYPAAGATPSISNTPDTKAFGTISAQNTHWSNGSEPSWPLVDGDAYFTLTNDGSIAVNVSANATNPTGGIGATLVSGSPGADEIRVTVFEEGDGSGDGLVLTTTQQAFIANLTASSDVDWEFKMEVGTTTETPATQKTYHIYLVATAS